MRILAVDDDEFILEILPTIAQRAGFSEITTASSAERALEILADNDVNFDCLLFDVMMPGMDGIELCAKVRRLPAYRLTPILMLTSARDMKYVDEAFKVGATDYVTKPFEIIELGARLRTAQELSVARRHAPALADELRHPFDLEDEVKIEGVENLVDYAALGNYLTQLSSERLATIQVVAIKIKGIETFYDRASTDQFIFGLKAIARATAAVFPSGKYMMAYAGNGIFVVLSDLPTSISFFEMEIDIQRHFNKTLRDCDDEGLLDLAVAVGRPTRPYASKTQRVKKTFGRAISRVEGRLARKAG